MSIALKLWITFLVSNCMIAVFAMSYMLLMNGGPNDLAFHIFSVCWGVMAVGAVISAVVVGLREIWR